MTLRDLRRRHCPSGIGVPSTITAKRPSNSTRVNPVTF
jgi:hypothetical protein